MSLLEQINSGLLYFDGATGTELQKLNIPSDIRPEIWNIENPNALIQLHKNYLQAGANILKANTFGANRLHFSNSNYSVSDIISAGIKNAKNAIDFIYPGSDKHYVALDIGPLGRLIEPLGDLPFEEAVSIFSEMVIAGVNAQADLILIETMVDSYETKAAVIAAKENSNLPIFVTNTYDQNEQLMTGASPEAMVALLEGLRVDAIGANCGFGPSQMKNIVKRLYNASSTPIIINPNAGLPQIIDDKTVYNVTPEQFGEEMKDMISCGARILGGCCGTTPLHIEKLKDFTCDLLPKELIKQTKTVISSYSHIVSFGESFKTIGERINPTGKKKIKEALKTQNYDTILEEATIQSNLNVDVLDVNVGVPGIDESETMCTCIKKIQGVSNLPLQIDSSDPKVLENALRIYNGKPLVNSVNGKIENMKTIFPIIAKYGGVIIGLTLDEDGIPDSSELRLKIAEKIINTAKEYGIDKKDIIIDPLTLAVSVDSNAAKVTLDSVKSIRDNLQVNTSLGVSNVSFGLPNREIINAKFLDVAMDYGLNTAIINPLSSLMTNTISEYTTEKQTSDEKYKSFTDALTLQTEVESFSINDINSFTLKDCIIKGLSSSSSDKTSELLTSHNPLDIIDSMIIPALNYVGDCYEQKKMFLPQLLASAEAAKKSFDVIKNSSFSNTLNKKAGKIIIATVEGDVHDIGKNIVATLLDNYGFEVIDLGKDVPANVILQECKNNNASFVGLSALMTTTVPSMKNTIELLKANLSKCYIVVGGAVLNEEIAKDIHADSYAKDAMDTVHLAEKYFK